MTLKEGPEKLVARKSLKRQLMGGTDGSSTRISKYL